MTEFTFSVLHLGNIADLDPVDGDSTAENQSALLGTYRSDSDPAYDHITTVTAQDTNSDSLINSNDTGTPEAVSFDLGAGPVNTFYDSLFNVDVTVNFTPGSGEPPYTGLAGIIQTETGDLFFVMLDDDAGFGANSFDDFPIESITINSISVFGDQQTASASDDQEFVTCFTAGTLIKTRHGPVPVETLKTGDQVATHDNGDQPIKWIGHQHITARRMSEHPNLRAICISADALGRGYPEQDLIVSPQHRVLLNSDISKLMTDEAEVLIAAIKLVGFPGIHHLSCSMGANYYHIACADHQLIWANGTLTETLLLGPQVRKGLSEASRLGLQKVMPHAFGQNTPALSKPVRPIIERRALIQNILARHVRSDTQLVNA